MAFSSTTRGLALAALFAALTAVGALFAIPAPGPVPFTLQVFFVLAAGLLLGPRLAGLSMIVYLILGLVAPVYAQGSSGIGTLLGPTGGYLWGFVLGAMLAGWLSHATVSPGWPKFTLAAVAGLVPIYGLGAAWLAVSLGTTDLTAVLSAGVLPFLPLDLVKALLAAAVARSLVSSPLGLPAPAQDR